MVGSTQCIFSARIIPYQFRLNTRVDALRYSLLFDTNLVDVHLRCSFVKHLNRCLLESLPYIDLREFGPRIRQLSNCVFCDIKHKFVEADIEEIEFSGESRNDNARITLDRLQTAESRDDREVEPYISKCFLHRRSDNYVTYILQSFDAKVTVKDVYSTLSFLRRK